MNDIPATPQGVDASAPHSARVWNYWLGGKDNYPVDRVLGDQILATYPKFATDARAGRAFLVRAITHLAGQEKVRGFLDVGTGLPTHHNTHEIAQAIAPESRVVYVDNDPMVLAHARALLNSSAEGATDYVDADLREPEKVLARAGEVIDLDRPIGLSIIGTLGHIPDLEQALGVMRTYLDALPSGSFLVFGDLMSEEASTAEAVDQWNESATLPYRSHSLAEITSFFDGLEILAPGVGPVTEWRPGDVEVGSSPDTDMYGGVARKP